VYVINADGSGYCMWSGVLGVPSPRSSHKYIQQNAPRKEVREHADADKRARFPTVEE